MSRGVAKRLELGYPLYCHTVVPLKIQISLSSISKISLVFWYQNIFIYLIKYKYLYNTILITNEI